MTRLLFLIITVFLFSCKSKKETEKESIGRTLKIYSSAQLKDIDSTLNLDSLRIIRIDTVSSREDLMFKILSLQESFNILKEESQSATKKLEYSVYQLRLLRSMNSSRSDLSIFEDDVKYQHAEAQKIIEEMALMANKIDTLAGMWFSVDSTNFLYYGVAYKLCYSDKKLVQKCFDSAYVNITKDFRVKPIN
jgi:hypothetical protein